MIIKISHLDFPITGANVGFAKSRAIQQSVANGDEEMVEFFQSVLAYLFMCD